MAIFPEDRRAPALDCDVVQIKLSELQLHRPRQWGACWLACQLWDQLALDEYWSHKLSPSRKGARWLNVFKTLVCYKTTLSDFLAKIERQYGKAQRTWVMDRGIPTEETLQEMREANPAVHYLVGTPKGRLTQLEKAFLKRPWEKVREAVEVKLLDKDGEIYVLAKSAGRVDKERAMRRRRLKKLWKRLQELQQQKLTRDQLLIKLGAAKKEAGRAYYLVDIQLPEKDQDVTAQTFNFSLRKKKLRHVRRREGRYLLRSNLRAEDPALLWQYYLQLIEIEQAFKELKSDLSIRPIYHQKKKKSRESKLTSSSRLSLIACK